MSVINQVLRDLDSRKTGKAEAAPGVKADPAAIARKVRAGRWRALLFSLPALAFAGAVAWYGPGLWHALVKPSVPARSAEVAESGKAAPAAAPVPSAELAANGAPRAPAAAPAGVQTGSSTAPPAVTATPPTAATSASAMPPPPAGAGSAATNLEPSRSDSRSATPGSGAGSGPAPAAGKEPDAGAPAPVPPAPATRPGTTAAKRDDTASTTQIERTSLSPLAASGPDGQYREAMQRYHAGRLEDAASLLQAALKADPRHTASRQALAAMFIDRRDSKQAQVILQEGLALDPAQSAFATMSARLSLAAGDPESAVKTLQGAAIDKAPPELHAMLAGVLSRLRRDREALNHWNAALQRNPAQANWWLGLGVSLEADGRAQDARTAFERALGAPGLRPEAADYARERLNAAR